jgi:hypothetical protein
MTIPCSITVGQLLFDRRLIILNTAVIAHHQAELNQNVCTAEIVIPQGLQEQRLSVQIGGIVIMSSQKGDPQVLDRRLQEVQRRRDALGVWSMLLLVGRERGSRMRDVILMNDIP